LTGEIDAATARIVFHNGCVADVSASRVSDEKKRLLRVFDGGNVYSADYQTQTAGQSSNGGAATPELAARDISLERRDTLNEEIRAFVRSIQTGSRPAVSGREGRRALALAGLITESISSGTTGFVPVGKV
jgi:predicted dehydrogenase